ncbi:tRNA dimethylallyltransferase 9 isoform X1 [Cajanus cajan]|uniref:tRNA dimethylallyltransferase n=1 Tax=Cajanus cajan TaxID=3821 RepID=A0A151S9E9_CAJCA|nr:tRNA dimethylallyltransferase 9 isoform X1 [Cajanus cajan]KYP51387.1 tRNA Delta(2)-isopentenylpyrophosphate transferase [Cajanus cajan]
MLNNGVCSLRTCLRFPESPLFLAPPRSFCCRRRFLVAASEAKKKEKVIVISGPTGSGKSRLALELAKRLNGEIVSADSVQVYRGLDVGSAKPSPNERKEVPHHLVDILHPSEDYSVGQFFEDGRQATRGILDKGRVPIVVGGTGLYLRWFIYGKPDVPKASPEITSEAHHELAELQRKEDWDTAVQLVVKAGDPKAQFLTVNDWYRLRRSLEIIKSSGSPPSAFRVPYDSFREQGEYSVGDGSESSDKNTYGDAVEETNSSELDYEFICFFLSSQRLDLYKSIDFRCEDMLLGRDGILSEAQWLLDMGLHPNSNSATKAIGYRQAMEYLLNCREQGGESSVREFYKFLSEFQKASRNFAKRQLTWFRNEHIYHWLDASKSMETILNFIHGAYHDWNGSLLVPEHLRMSRDISNRKEATQIKSYRTKNRHFVNGEDCSPILNWIKKTQR